MSAASIEPSRAPEQPPPLRSERSRRFQFGVFDLAVLLALVAVAINGIIELYRDSATDRDFRGGLRQIGTPLDGSPPPALRPEPPRDRVVAVIGPGMRFTAFWLRRFATCVIVTLLGSVLSFLATALVLRNSGSRLRRALPRLAAALVCLLFLAALSELNYLQHHTESYIEIHGRRIHPAVHAAWWALGPAVGLTIVIAGVELAAYVTALRQFHARWKQSSLPIRHV